MLLLYIYILYTSDAMVLDARITILVDESLLVY